MPNNHGESGREQNSGNSSSRRAPMCHCPGMKILLVRVKRRMIRPTTKTIKNRTKTNQLLTPMEDRRQMREVRMISTSMIHKIL